MNSTFRTILATLFLGLMLMGYSGRTSATTAEEPLLATPQIAEMEDGVRVAWNLPEVSPDGDWGEGLIVDQEPGRYQLPLKSFGVAIPIEANPTIRIIDVQTSQPVELTKPLEIAPKPQGLMRDESGAVVGGDFAEVIASDNQATDWVTFEEIGKMAGVRLGRLTIRPFLALDETTVQGLHSIEAELNFNSSIQDRASNQSEPLTFDFENQVINPSHLETDVPQVARSAANTQNRPTVFIQTGESVGIVEVTYAELQAAGFPVDSHPLVNYRLFRGETEIAWLVTGQGTNSLRLEASESIKFFAPAVHSRWMKGQVFKLVADFEPGRQMATASAAPAGLQAGSQTVSVLAEEDLVYTPQCFCGRLPVARDGDRWMWHELKLPGAETFETTIGTPNVDTIEPAKIMVWLMGFTTFDEVVNDHRLEVRINGREVGTVLWDGQNGRQGVFNVPAGILTDSNTVTLTLEETDALFDGVWVDAVQLDYVRSESAQSVFDQLQFSGENSRSEYSVPVASNVATLFDVTDPDAPILLKDTELQNGRLTFSDPTTGTHFYQVVPFSSEVKPVSVRPANSLTEVSYGADYLIITTDLFADDLDGLIELRTEQGYRVAVENVAAIYDRFGHGEPNPAVIQAFLAHAWQSWSPKPMMVLLVGDGHFDPRKNLEGSIGIQIPPFLIDSDPWMGETAADNRFVTLDGPDDQLPEMMIGRLPVNDPAELQAIIEKIKNRETRSQTSDWLGTFTLVSDNPDSAGNFPTQSNELIETYLPSPWRSEHYFLLDGVDSGAALLNQFKNRWERGHGLVMFTGHSSFNQWAVERIFHKDEIPTLSTGERLPLVLSMSCFTSSYHYPENDVLDEEFIRSENGAIATWGSTGVGVSTGHDSLSAGFLETILESEETTVGSAAMAGKLQLVIDQSPHLDLLDTFTLLGDPATEMGFKQPAEFYSLYLPLAVR